MYIVSYILYGYKANMNKKIEDYLPQTTTTTVCLHTTTALGKATIIIKINLRESD